MKKLLTRNIKDLIVEYPAIAAVLNKFNIGCTSCAVGTCQLKDIIEIHNLSQHDEAALFAGIAAIAFPDQSVEIPQLARKDASAVHKRKLSPPLAELVEEHVHIKRVISALPGLLSSITSLDKTSKERIGTVIEFIRNYADKFHHAKEENILFCMFESSHDIIAAMLTDHTSGREYVKAALACLDKNDVPGLAKNLTAYGVLLFDHIKKEDEILYPWMDRQLTDAQVGKLFAQFRDVDREFGGKPNEYVKSSQTMYQWSV